jgi:phosphatidylglycerol:prolipoprotein diacylglycerol transferase
MYPDKILGLFHLYGLMIGVGILACFSILYLYGKKEKVEESFMDFVFYNTIVAIALGFGAAALFQATYNYIENPEAGFDFGSGITFIGGLIGGVISFLVGYAIFRKRFKTRLVDIISFIPCCILIAHAFGRVGCLFAGCCHGEKTTAWYGIFMHTVEFGYAKVVPTQLFEALFLFALFAICFILVWKKKFKHNMSLYLIAYGIFRFLLEFLRADDRGQLLGIISPSQFWSLLMIVAGVAVYFLLEWLYKKRAAELAAAGESVALDVTEKTENKEQTTVAEETQETETVETKSETVQQSEVEK